MNAPADVDTKIGRQAQRVLARLKKNRTAAGLLSIAGLVLGTLRDLAPIVVVVAVFQVAILRQPFPDLGGMIGGLVLVMLGLVLFIKGLEMGLFPLGEGLAQGFAHKGSLIWLLVFAFALGFGTTVAEPALIAVTAEAARVAADPDAMDAYALGLRYTVALSVGVGITLGVLRIIKGWPLHYWIIGGYVVAVGLTFLAPDEIVGIAYDSGGVTTSTITVPMVTALGVGLATAIRGRNPLIDGFGLIAYASLTPIIFVLIFGMVF